MWRFQFFKKRLDYKGKKIAIVNDSFHKGIVIFGAITGFWFDETPN